MADTAPDPVAAYLAGASERYETAADAVYSTLLGRAQALTSLDDVPCLVAGYGRLLELHVKMDKPARHYHHCPAHAYDPETRSFGSFETVRDCPDCTYTEVWLCKHCECPNDEWPCPTYQAISAALLGKETTLRHASNSWVSEDFPPEGNGQ